MSDASTGSLPPLPHLPRALLHPLAIGYGAAVRWRNRRFDRGRAVRRLDLPVISIGNIVAGGTGKTPTTIWLARRLIARGLRPLIALRGYAAVGGPSESDEAREYRDALPETPLALGADRVRAITDVAAAVTAANGRGPGAPGVDLVLLDDGFQHRRIHRDLDVVLVDASRPSLGDRLLPCGWLREPATALRRADAVVVTRASGVDPALAATIRLLHGKEPIAWLRHHWGTIERHDPQLNAASFVEPVEWLRGRRVACCAGIGNPEAFVRQLTEAGSTVVARLPVRDHERYGERSIVRLAAAARGADALVITPKDWVKLRELEWQRIGVPIVLPRLAIEPLEHEGGVEALERLVLDRIGSVRARSG